MTGYHNGYYWSMIAIWVFIMLTLIVMMPGPKSTQTQIDALTKRVELLEKQQCSLMSIETPDGRKTICAVFLNPSK